MKMTQVKDSMKVPLKTKLLVSDAEKAKKSVTLIDEEYVTVKSDEDTKEEKIEKYVYTSGSIRERTPDTVSVNEGLKIPVPFKDEIRVTLQFDDYLTTSTSSAYYASIAPQVTSLHSWAYFSGVFTEYKVNSITQVIDLAKPGERRGSFATGRPSMLWGYSPVALTSFQKVLDNKHVKWLDPCPGHYIFKTTIKKPGIYMSSSPVIQSNIYQLTSAAGNAHNGYFTIAMNESIDTVTCGFPIAWYFDITFKGRASP